MLQIGEFKSLLHVNETMIHMHIYWARKNILKEMFDGASKKTDGSMH